MGSVTRVLTATPSEICKKPHRYQAAANGEHGKYIELPEQSTAKYPKMKYAYIIPEGQAKAVLQTPIVTSAEEEKALEGKWYDDPKTAKDNAPADVKANDPLVAALQDKVKEQALLLDAMRQPT
jgi:hypothetical protein